jgi:glycine/D-amino acid oxidase-like deaminating enzyme/nitrite reductase/ring-hydroxylating ferredoxin subunit
VHTSPWLRTRSARYGELTKSGHYDVVVIGGGITGVTAAYLLTRAGKRVCLLERDRLAAGDTGHTTAHLTQVTDLRLTKLAKRFGNDQARAVWNAGAAAINTIENVARAEQIDCEFRRVPGFLHASLDSHRNEERHLKQEAELALDLGFEAKFVPAVPYCNKPGIRFSNQAKFHPLRFLVNVAAAAVRSGCTICEHTNVDEVADDTFLLRASDVELRADYLVVATHVPLMAATGLLKAATFQTKLSSYSSYVVGASVPHGLIPEASFWDTSDPYYYLRVDAGRRFDHVIFGGEDHKTGQAADTKQHFRDLERRLLQFLPDAKVVEHWSGQVVETNDGLPYIGESAERQFIATGFAGNGMTFGVLAAMMACDRVLGRENCWQDLLAPTRKHVRGGTWRYLKENVDYPYFLVGDHVSTPDEASSLRAVKRNEGKIVKLPAGRVACFRDEDGKLVAVSAVCTHLGCLVHWNGAEQTWDCPCHGSRFHPNGEVLAGPAESPLEKISTAAEKKTASNGQSRKPARHRSARP